MENFISQHIFSLQQTKKWKKKKVTSQTHIKSLSGHIQNSYPSNTIDSARQRTKEVGSYHEMQIWSIEAQRINIIPRVSETNAVKLCLRHPAGRAREKQSALDTLELVSNHTDARVPLKIQHWNIHSLRHKALQMAMPLCTDRIWIFNTFPYEIYMAEVTLK